MADVSKIKIESATYDIKDTTARNKFNYSSSEQEIGTWIDGNTLYRKVFECDNPTSGGYPVSDTGITANKIKFFSACCLTSTGNMLGLGYNGFWCQIDVARKIYYVNPNYTGAKLIVTVLYTKV